MINRPSAVELLRSPFQFSSQFMSKLEFAGGVCVASSQRQHLAMSGTPPAKLVAEDLVSCAFADSIEELKLPCYGKDRRSGHCDTSSRDFLSCTHGSQ
jgi:hypothetical protein